MSKDAEDRKVYNRIKYEVQKEKKKQKTAAEKEDVTKSTDP